MTQCITGTAITASSEAGARLFDQAIESYLASRSDTPQILKEALTADPQLIMASCFMGYLTRLAGDRKNAVRAAELHRGLLQTIESGAGNDWERRHVSALGLWLADDLHTLMRHLEAVLDDYPNDIVALRMLHYLYFYDGDAARMRDSVAAFLPRYAGHPLEGYVKGMQAFALEESGDYDAAERFGREAVDINASDAWAAHAVAHVLQMQGRWAEGMGWIDGLRQQWQHTNNFRFHLFWHEALYYLAERDLDAVLAIYDRDVAPPVQDDFYLDVCNAASLLLRLEAEGVDVGDRWQPLARIAEQHVDDAELVFASLHYLMPLLRTGHPAADRLRQALERWAERDTTQGHVVRDVALDVAAFLADCQSGERAAAAERFQRFRDRLHRIGGSNAQRQVFEIMEQAVLARPRSGEHFYRETQ